MKWQRFVKVFSRPTMWRAGTSRSNIAGRKVKEIDCKLWQLIWSADK